MAGVGPGRRIVESSAAGSGLIGVDDIVVLNASSKAGKYYAKAEINSVESVSGRKITLRRPTAFDYSDVSETHRIRVVGRYGVGTGSVTGLDGEPAYVVRNAGLRNLTLTGSNSAGFKALHLSCFDCAFSELTLNHYAGITGNPCGGTVINNIEANFVGRGIELGYLTNHSTLENVHLHRVATSTDGAKFILGCLTGSEDGGALNHWRTVHVEEDAVSDTARSIAEAAGNGDIVGDVKIKSGGQAGISGMGISGASSIVRNITVSGAQGAGIRIGA
ncbi:MAG: hypothetical protein AAGF58_16325, partial [Pseudomonadota bacterium]